MPLIFCALKKIAVILLLALIFLQTGGYYFIFCINISEAKREAALYISGGVTVRAVTLTFPVQNGKVIASDMVFNDEDEFSYQGRMYDVISTERTKDHISFKCYHDRTETELTQDLSDKINADRDMPAHKNKEIAVFKMLLQYLPSEDKEDFYPSPQNSTSYFPLNSAMIQSSVYRPIVSPPPEFIHG